MSETLQLGDIEIAVTRKAVKNVHLSVHPPAGQVTLVAPTGTRLEVARAYHTATIDTPTNECTGIIGVSGEKQGCIYMTASRAMLGNTGRLLAA